MLTWDQLTEAEQLHCEYSDFHKEVYGFRPRCSEEQMNSVDWLKTAIASLVPVAKHVFAEEYRREQVAIEAFEMTIRSIITTGAGDRTTAIRWMRDSFTDETVKTDDDYFRYLTGLPYTYKLI